MYGEYYRQVRVSEIVNVSVLLPYFTTHRSITLLFYVNEMVTRLMVAWHTVPQCLNACT